MHNHGQHVSQGLALTLPCHGCAAVSTRAQPKKCATLFVKNIPYTTDEGSMQEFFRYLSVRWVCLRAASQLCFRCCVNQQIWGR